MTLTTAVARVQAIARQCTGVRASPAQPTESADVLPVAISWPENGTLTPNDATFTTGLHTIRCEMHASRDMLKDAVQKITGWAEQFPKHLAGDPTLDGAVDSIVFPVTYSVQSIQWGETPTLALVWQVPVKILAAPTTPTT